MRTTMKRRLTSVVAALALVGLASGTVLATKSHTKIDRSATSAGGSANPDSLGTTQEVSAAFPIPGSTTVGGKIDNAFALAIGATDSLKIQVEVCPHALPAADTIWYFAAVDTVDSMGVLTLTIPDAGESMLYYRVVLDDIQAAALRATIWETYEYTRGGRGW